MAEPARGPGAERVARRLEVAKLAYLLDVAPEEFAFLTEHTDATALRQLRQDISDSLYSRHEARFATIAQLSGMLPTAIAAKAAESAIGPVVSAHIAAAQDPDNAVKLAGRLSPGFLADLALSLDPSRAGEIVARLDEALLLGVGRLLLERGEYLVLARFVSVVSTRVALALIADAEPHALLETALLTDEPAVLSPIVAGLEAQALAGLVEYAHDEDRHEDALALTAALDAETRERLIATFGDLDEDVRAAFTALDPSDWPGLDLRAADHSSASEA